VFDKVSEHRYKFFFLALQIIPPSPERFLRHCRKIKADQKDLAQRIPVSLNVFRASDGPENFDDAIHATLKLLLRGLGRSVLGQTSERAPIQSTRNLSICAQATSLIFFYGS